MLIHFIDYTVLIFRLCSTRIYSIGFGSDCFWVVDWFCFEWFGLVEFACVLWFGLFSILVREVLYVFGHFFCFLCVKLVHYWLSLCSLITSCHSPSTVTLETFYLMCTLHNLYWQWYDCMIISQSHAKYED